MLLHYIIDLLIHTAVWAVCLMLVNGLAVAVASVARGTATLDGIGDWRIVAARVSLYYFHQLPRERQVFRPHHHEHCYFLVAEAQCYAP
mmetsp:Transcript_6238/g.10190  ORF Transcript_6238/g.10190 Transcript_6238/m.10190 type:complete len:89 (-) Transcript_6238:742-1008(-)